MRTKGAGTTPEIALRAPPALSAAPLDAVPRYMRRLSETPRLYVADNFITASEAAHVMRRAHDANWLTARAIAPNHNQTGYSLEMPVPGDTVLTRISKRLVQTTGIVNRHGATMRYRSYAPGEWHGGHTDTYEIAGAHLILTALVCLTDVEDGGETAFPNTLPEPVAVSPARHRLIVWFNHRPDGAVDPQAYHEGRPVAAGRKATLTSFVYA